ncbi:hypothetical protein CHN50_10310 [Priestia aryabhattai]|nr:hypothetical protein CHN50_10310 [Priestia aryabhattai]
MLGVFVDVRKENKLNVLVAMNKATSCKIQSYRRMKAIILIHQRLAVKVEFLSLKTKEHRVKV